MEISICASEISIDDEAAFGLARPPGHHASPGSCSGFCYFNNIAVAVRRATGARRAVIVDFDLHFGDGTSNTLEGDPNITYRHMGASPMDLESYLSSLGEFDILAVSAGFDTAVADWGGTLTDEDYRKIGELLKRFSEVPREAIRDPRRRLQPQDPGKIDSKLLGRIRLAKRRTLVKHVPLIYLTLRRIAWPLRLISP